MVFAHFKQLPAVPVLPHIHDFFLQSLPLQCQFFQQRPVFRIREGNQIIFPLSGTQFRYNTVNILDQLIVGMLVHFLLYEPLCGSPHDTGIIDYSCISLHTGNGGKRSYADNTEYDC